jgi:transposase InsO family protein
LVVWCETNGIELEFIQPGKPAQNAFILRMRGSSGDGVLVASVFIDLEQFRQERERWPEKGKSTHGQHVLRLAVIIYRKDKKECRLRPCPNTPHRKPI